MHTYIKKGDIWLVGCDSSHSFINVREFTEEWQAALYASFLNGGNTPVNLLKEIFGFSEESR
jgi:hypothetical protein